MSEQDYEQLTLFPVDSHASHFLLPGSDEAQKMTVISGQKCLELSWNSGPLGSLVRMLLESSVWRSTRCFLTWKVSATPHKRLLFRLVPSKPHTDATGAPLWPTPTARDCKGANSMEHLQREGKRNHADQLANAVKLWPTPRVGGSKGKSQSGVKHGDLAAVVFMYQTPTTGAGNGGQLNPMWVEWLMNFPLGWTEV